MNRSKLLFICPNYPGLGGVETVTGLLVDFFLAKDAEVFLLVSATSTAPHRHDAYLQRIPFPPNSTEYLRFVDAFIRDKGIDVVFNQGVFSQVHQHAFLHPNTRYINTLHAEPFWEIDRFMSRNVRTVWAEAPNGLGRVKWLIRWTLGKLDSRLSHPFIRAWYRRQIEASTWYVVLDESHKELLEKTLYHGVPQARIKVIPNPIAGAPCLEPIVKTQTVLYAGRLDHGQKRVDRLLRIWSKVEADFPEWDLQIAGQGEAETRLKALSASLGLQRVHFLGRREMTELYRAASILCLTSTWEGLPLVIPEAQSQGVVPMVFGSIRALPRLIEPGRDGVVVPPFDEEAFAVALREVMGDAALRQRLSMGAIQRAGSFSLERIGERWLTLLEQDPNDAP
jgi:glycosyltransferase involved in cell wall biosynthesis